MHNSCWLLLAIASYITGNRQHLLPSANEVVGGCAWRGACVVVVGEHAWQGSMRGRGACMAGGVCGGGGACMVGGMCGRGGHVWQGHVWWGVCVVGGVCGGGHAWQGVWLAGGHAWQEGHAWQWACIARGVHVRGVCMHAPPADTKRYGQ